MTHPIEDNVRNVVNLIDHSTRKDDLNNLTKKQLVELIHQIHSDLLGSLTNVKEPQICVGRWDFLDFNWMGIHGLNNASHSQILEETKRQCNIHLPGYKHDADPFVGIYTLEEFEEKFNADNSHLLNGSNYWIKVIIL